MLYKCNIICCDLGWKGSPWRDRLSLAILELQEKGMIQLLYNKWWKNTGDVCNRDDKKDSKASPLGMDNIGGVFVVLLAGLILAILIAVCEFFCHVRKNASMRKVKHSYSRFWIFFWIFSWYTQFAFVSTLIFPDICTNFEWFFYDLWFRHQCVES